MGIRTTAGAVIAGLVIVLTACRHTPPVVVPPPPPGSAGGGTVVTGPSDVDGAELLLPARLDPRGTGMHFEPATVADLARAVAPDVARHPVDGAGHPLGAVPATADLRLAYYSDDFRPDYQHRLVWLLMVHDIPDSGVGHGGGAEVPSPGGDHGSGAATYEFITIIDAATGRAVQGIEYPTPR